MSYTERERRRRAERKKRHEKIMRIRRIIKACIYAALVFIAFLVIWFAVRPAISKHIDKNKTQEVAEETVEVKTIPGTAVKKTLQNPSEGNVGWNVNDSGWWFKNEDDTQFVSGWQDIEGQRYYFTEEGYLATGWQNIDGEDIFFDESGIIDEDAHLKLVALTYDDGPSVNTDTILDVLEENDAKATFFVVGTMAENCQDQLKREHELGMQIGNHTYDHTILEGSDADTISSVLEKNEEVIESIIGIRPEIIRPTGGGTDEVVRSTVDQPLIIWDVDTLDWSTRDADSTYNAVMEDVQDGSIILMHDLYEATAEATKRIVPALKEQGYKMVTIDELAQKYGYTMEPQYRYFNFYPDGRATIYTPDGENLADLNTGEPEGTEE